MAAVEYNRLEVKDLITLGVLTTVFIVFFAIGGMTLGVFPATYLLMPAVMAVPLGTVFMLLMAKIAKTGTFLLSGVLQGIVLLLLGVYWPVLIAVMIAAILGEIIIWGLYKSFKRIAISYAVLISGYSLGSFIPLVFFADSYKVMALNRGYEAAYIDKLIALLSGPVLAGVLAVSVAGALLGAALGKKILKKHFIKAGII